MSSLLKISEAARKVNVHEQTIRRQIKANALKPILRGKTTYVDLADLKRLYPDDHAPARRATTGASRRISVINQKGGVGKTTTTINLCACIAKEGYRVLAVDCDAQANMTRGFGIKPDELEVTLYDVMIRDVAAAEAIVTPYPNEYPTLHVLPSKVKLASADLALTEMFAGEMCLMRSLERYFDDYDYIFFDCAPSLGLLTLNMLVASTEVIIPSDMGIWALEGLNDLLATINKVETINPGLGSRWALANMTDTTLFTSEIVKDLERSFQDKLFKTHIRRSVRAKEAQAEGKPMGMYKPTDPLALAYEALAQEVVSHGRA